MQAEHIINPAPVYRVKLTHFDKGVGEFAFWYDEPIGRDSRREAMLYPPVRSRSSEPSETNQERAARRAKSKMRKLIMSMRADRMLTLTFRDNITDLDKAQKLFVRFIKLVHASYPSWQYVAVPEKQKRGAWHFHLAVSGFQDVGFLRAAWRSLVDGNIDVTSSRTRGDKRAASASIAAYLAKYLAKTFESSELNKHRYRASLGIEINSTTIWLQAQSWRDAISEVLSLCHEKYNQVGNIYLSDDFANGWICSWSLDRTRSKASNRPLHKNI